MTDRELLQMALDALRHLCLHTAAIRGYDGEQVQTAIDALKARLAQPENKFNPDWDAMAVMVEEQQRMAKRIEGLEAQLAQPEPAECDGGQCGIGGYCKECPKPLVKLKEMLEVQGRDGTWNYDHYFHGMYNGMEVMLAVLEGREPVFREAPEKWLSKKEWVGLTKEELAEIAEFHFHGAFSGRDFYDDVEAKLKEKNT